MEGLMFGMVSKSMFLLQCRVCGLMVVDSEAPMENPVAIIHLLDSDSIFRVLS